MSKGEGKKIGIEFTSALIGDVSGNVSAFTIKGKEYKHTNGPLLDRTYEIASIENHPTRDNSLLITMKEGHNFNNTSGNLTIIYDENVGTLSGVAGAVESFTRAFKPTDLVAEPTPGVAETISLAPTGLDIELVPIEYIDIFAEETESITVAPTSLEIELVHIDIENP